MSHTPITETPMNTDRYITCRVKVNGAENGRTEILDTHIDGGEGEPLIVASFFDRGEAEFFRRAGNREWKRCSVSPKPDPDPTIDEDRCSECGARSLNAICPACQEETVRILNDPTRGHAL